MSDVFGQQRIWVRGEGSRLFDAEGRSFIDGCASLWYVNAGYGRSEIVDAVTRQMSALPAWMLFGPNVAPATVELAERLASLTPGDLNRIYFSCGGSESNEMAFKIARQYFRLRGEHGRYKVISRRGSYHGSTFGALSATGTAQNRKMFEPLVPGFRHVAPDSIDELVEAIELEGAETVAAMIVDPSAAASGIRFPPEGYLSEVREICSRHGILMIADEVICGFGRTGTWFGVDHWEVTPDMITMAKGMSSGYLPIGGVAVSSEVVEPFTSSDPAVNSSFMSGNTYAGHATCCAAALANIAIIERDNLLTKSSLRGTQLFDLCREFESSPLVSGVSGGRGLAVGIELNDDQVSDPAIRIAAAAYSCGVIVRPLTRTIITLSPPLIITAEEINEIGDALAYALDSIEKETSSV
jgi:adenosylmethionine-8-amino-7-oxononanoate aminotransferase